MNFREPKKKNTLAIHTIFVPRENILFIREWIVYHIGIGVSHFYLYDNTGSIGGKPTLKKRTEIRNKYGIDFQHLTNDLSDGDIKHQLNELNTIFPGLITYVRWDPRDENGNIVYAQPTSICDYYNKFSKHHDWTAFIDMDEFIFPSGEKNLLELIKDYENKGYGDIIIMQKKFAERFDYLDRYVIEITRCIDNINTINWAPKHIIHREYYDDSILNNPAKIKKWGIHTIPTKAKKVFQAPIDELRFNHYNTNTRLLNWLKKMSVRKNDIYLDGEDDSMKIHYDFVNKHCLKLQRPYNWGRNVKPERVTNQQPTRNFLFNYRLSFSILYTSDSRKAMIRKIFRRIKSYLEKK